MIVVVVVVAVVCVPLCVCVCVCVCACVCVTLTRRVMRLSRCARPVAGGDSAVQKNNNFRLSRSLKARTDRQKRNTETVNAALVCRGPLRHWTSTAASHCTTTMKTK
jgi:hypothetical protein